MVPGDRMSRKRNIGIAAVLNIGFTAVEIVGGLLTNSLSIVADALHDVGDSIALSGSWVLESRAQKPPDARRTFGYQRLSLFAAFLSGGILIAGSVIILTEAVNRLRSPEEVDPEGMILLAILGVSVNVVAFARLRTGEALSERVLSWHLLEDVLGWVIILAGAVVIRFWGIHSIDTLMTFGLTVFILWGVGRNLKESLNVLMEGVPEHIDLSEVRESLLSVEGVRDVHDVHVWSLEGETDLFTGHIVVDDRMLKKPDRTRREIKDVLRHHHIEHSTTELESEDFCSGIECSLKPREET